MKKVLFATPSGYLFGNVDGYNRTCVVGRSLVCDFVLGDEAISRRHFFLRVNDEGDLLVGDLDSMNGTFINGERLAVCDENGSLEASPEAGALVQGERVFKI